MTENTCAAGFGSDCRARRRSPGVASPLRRRVSLQNYEHSTRAHKAPPAPTLPLPPSTSRAVALLRRCELGELGVEPVGRRHSARWSARHRISCARSKLPKFERHRLSSHEVREPTRSRFGLLACSFRASSAATDYDPMAPAADDRIFGARRNFPFLPPKRLNQAKRFPSCNRTLERADRAPYFLRDRSCKGPVVFAARDFCEPFGLIFRNAELARSLVHPVRFGVVVAAPETKAKRSVHETTSETSTARPRRGHGATDGRGDAFSSSSPRPAWWAVLETPPRAAWARVAKDT